MKVPKFRATKAEYPHIHKDHDGRIIPEVLGLCSLLAATCDAPGAIEPVYTDTTTHEYLISRGSLKGVDEVYANGKLVASANYDIVYKDNGQTYIKFATAKSNKRISINARGYFYEDWNSANGYVQNPALILLFFFAFIAEIAQQDLNMDSFYDVADYLDTRGWDEVGKLILQDETDTTAVIQELLFSIGAKYWVANDGRMTIGRRDVSAIALSPLIFAQLDFLAEPEKPKQFDRAVNYAKYSFDYYPAATLSRGSGIETYPDSIELFGTRTTEWSFPWITDETMAQERAVEELARLAYGNPQIKFPVPLPWIDRLDIFSTIEIQDLFGIDLLGEGEIGRYYQIVELAADPQNYQLNIIAEEIDWLLGLSSL